MPKETIRTIELDCAPGAARPDAYIEGIIKDTGLQANKPVKKFFGNWTWDFSDQCTAEQWEEWQPLFKERIENLYSHGFIRYGSW